MDEFWKWLGVSVTSWSLVPVIVSLLALWVSSRSYRYSNTTVVRLAEVEATYSHSFNESARMLLTVVVQNLGIALHNVRLRLSWKNADGWGTTTVALPLAVDGGGTTGQFYKGSFARFQLDGAALDMYGRKMFADLSNPDGQKPVLVMTADGFEVWRKRLTVRLLPAWRRWYNGKALKVEMKLWRRLPPQAAGQAGRVIPRLALPKFADHAFQLTSFVRGLQQVAGSTRTLEEEMREAGRSKGC